MCGWARRLSTTLSRQSICCVAGNEAVFVSVEGGARGAHNGPHGGYWQSLDMKRLDQFSFKCTWKEIQQMSGFGVLLGRGVCVL